jgi:translation initiation factor IF-1
MSKEDAIKADGKIIECLPGTKFKVAIGEDKNILCHLSGKMRINSIKLIEGDDVTVEMSPYDLTKGRIVFRK